jgi:hypothetical protein
MMYGEIRKVEPRPDPAVAVVDGARRPRRLRVLPRSYWLLLAIFVALQAADIVTTNCALAVSGNWEANPIMASYQADWGVVWWLPKAAAVAWICLATLLVRRWWPLVFAVSYSVAVVAANLAGI